MTITLFTPSPAEGDTIHLPDGTPVAAHDISAIPSTGETVICLGTAPRRATDPEHCTGGPLYGVISIDDLGTITGTLDGRHPCPYTAGDRIELTA